MNCIAWVHLVNVTLAILIDATQGGYQMQTMCG
jgi:hypothetical protein